MHPRKVFLRLGLFGAFCLVLPGISGTGDWPQFRGPDRNGEGPALNISAWPEKGPQVLWRRDIGNGFSAITIADGKLFTMFAGQNGDKRSEFAACLSQESGEVVWKTPLDDEFIEEFGNGPRSTPTYDNGKIYALSSGGHLYALEAATGKTIWHISFTDTFKTQVPRWGFSTSPLIEGDLVLIETGALEKEAFAALDKTTGEVRWKVADGQPGMTGYNSPIGATIGSQRQIIFAVGDNLTGVDLQGNQLWNHTWAERIMTIAMPLFIPPNKVFVSATGRGGGVMVEITGADPPVKELWKTRLIKNHFSSSVLYGGHLYGFDNATMKCVSVEDGEQLWAKRGFGKGSLILSGDKLLILGDKGDLALAKATPEGYQEISKHHCLEGKSWTAPVLAEGIIYLRNHSQIAAYRLAN